MAITYLAGNRLSGVSSDTKPSVANTALNAIFEETNTHDTYINNGTAWVLFRAASKAETLTNRTISNDNNILQNLVYDAIIYKTGSTYKGKLYDGTEVFSTTSGTTMATGVQTIFDGGGLILWPSFGGQFFQPGSTFTGWHLKSDTSLMMGTTRIIMPGTMNQPNDALFWIDDADQTDHVAKNITINGGRTDQGGASPSYEWTWLRMRSSYSGAAEGTTMCRIMNHFAAHCRNFIVLETLGAPNWVNGNMFRDLWCNYPNIGIQFVSGNPASSFTNNYFDNVVIQANPGSTDPGLVTTMTHGIKDITSKNNIFLGCKMWDMLPQFKACNLSPAAEDTIILNGLMTNNPLDWEMSCDFGKRTVVGFERDASTANMNFTLNNPFIRKSGAMYGIGSAATTAFGDGLLAGMGQTGAPSVITNSFTTDGLAKHAATSTTANTLAAIRSGSFCTIRYFNPVVKIRIKLNTTGSQRIFVGFLNGPASTLNTVDDPLANLTGYGLYHSTDNPISPTNWLVARNTGTASSTITDTGIVANITTPQTLFIAGWEFATPKWQWRVGFVTSQIGEHTTTIPGQTTGLAPGVFLGNITAADKSVDVMAMFLKHGKAEPN